MAIVGRVSRNPYVPTSLPLHTAGKTLAVQLTALVSRRPIAFGIGICQVPVAARDPRLVRVLPEEFAIDLDVWIVVHEDLRTSPRCQAVFDALVREFSAIDATGDATGLQPPSG